MPWTTAFHSAFGVVAEAIPTTAMLVLAAVAALSGTAVRTTLLPRTGGDAHALAVVALILRSLALPAASATPVRPALLA